MKFRQFAVRAFSVAAVAATACVGVGGAANAAPVDAPRLGVLGEYIQLVDIGGTCNGAVHVGMETDQAQPGKVRVKLTPQGLQGPNPSCDFNMTAGAAVGRFNGAGFDPQTVVPVSFPRGSFEPVYMDTTAGSGLNLIAVTPYMSLLGAGISYYMLVP